MQELNPNSVYLFNRTQNGEVIPTAFRKDPADADKYVVCTCARGENDYIVEFVDHYLNLGFDKIFICDNNDDDSVEAILEEYIADGRVEIFDCRGFESFQVQFYSAFCAAGNYKWCGYFDADEFLELNIYSNVKDFLETIEEDVISFNWLVFGTNGKYHKTEGSVQERFPQPIRPVLMFKENVFIKSIVRGGTDKFKGCWFNGSHIPVCEGEMTYNIGGMHLTTTSVHTHYPPKYKCGYVKHYYSKSFDEWIKKASRGWPDGTPTLNAANVFLCNNTMEYPIENYIESFFINSDNLYSIPERWKETLDTYDVIQFTNSDEQVYALTCEFMAVIRGCTNHTFVLTDKHIDDALFALFVEYGYATGNRVVFARNQDEVWAAYLKYSNRNAGTYYIIDLK